MSVWVGLILTVIAVLLIPILKLIWDAARKQQQIEDKQVELIRNMEKLVADKDAVHKEIIATIREDRAATDKRLRWLEENLWNTRKK
jgi:predicted Holliday junction resolvase-like endonuclease